MLLHNAVLTRAVKVTFSKACFPSLPVAWNVMYIILVSVSKTVQFCTSFYNSVLITLLFFFLLNPVSFEAVINVPTGINTFSSECKCLPAL